MRVARALALDVVTTLAAIAAGYAYAIVLAIAGETEAEYLRRKHPHLYPTEWAE